MAHKFSKLQNEMRNTQNQNQQTLGRSSIGRGVSVHADQINRELRRQTGEYNPYRTLGRLSMVYVPTEMMRENIGRSFYNKIQIEQAIDAAGASARLPLSVGRGQLMMSDEPSEHSTGTHQVYRVSSVVLRACLQADASIVDTHLERRALITNLVGGRPANIGQPELDLGAFAAHDRDQALDLLQRIDVLMPTHFNAGVIEIISPSKR